MAKEDRSDFCCGSEPLDRYFKTQASQDGFNLPKQHGVNRYSMINAGAETMADKPAYGAAFARRRCLMPADAFFEWRLSADSKEQHLSV